MWNFAVMTYIHILIYFNFYLLVIYKFLNIISMHIILSSENVSSFDSVDAVNARWLNGTRTIINRGRRCIKK